MLCIINISFNNFLLICRLKGHAKDLTIRHISKFIVNRQQLSDLGKLRFQLDFNLTFPLINVNGTYKIDGTVGDAFKIHGEGPFWYENKIFSYTKDVYGSGFVNTVTCCTCFFLFRRYLFYVQWL